MLKLGNEKGNKWTKGLSLSSLFLFNNPLYFFKVEMLRVWETRHKLEKTRLVEGVGSVVGSEPKPSEGSCVGLIQRACIAPSVSQARSLLTSSFFNALDTIERNQAQMSFLKLLWWRFLNINKSMDLKELPYVHVQLQWPSALCYSCVLLRPFKANSRCHFTPSLCISKTHVFNVTTL